MEAWEEAGLSREEYDEAMREMSEALGLDAPPSDAEVIGMHIQHVLDNVEPLARYETVTSTEMWYEMTMAFEEGKILREEYPDEAPKALLERLDAVAEAEGYDPETDGDIVDWANAVGRQYARSSGTSWPVVGRTVSSWPPETRMSERSDESRMHGRIDYVLNKVVPYAERNGYTTEIWASIAQAIEDGDVLQMSGDTNPLRMDSVKRLADFTHEKGYDPRAYGAGSVHDWADRMGRMSAEREGKAWPAEPGFIVPESGDEPFPETNRWEMGPSSSGDDLFGDLSRDEEPQSVHDVPFDEMLDYCIGHGEPWSRELTDELNRKVVEERDGIEREAYEATVRVENVRDAAQALELRREAYGIRGDEPDLPYYQAREFDFGRPMDEIIEDAEGRIRDAGRAYEDAIKSFYGRVYDYGSRDFSTVPDDVSGGLGTAYFAIQIATYKELGEDYSKFYRERLQEYASEKQREASGVDFSKPAAKPAEAAAPGAAKSVDAPAYVPHDYTPRFSDSPQGDFSDDFGDD